MRLSRAQTTQAAVGAAHREITASIERSVRVAACLLREGDRSVLTLLLPSADQTRADQPHPYDPSCRKAHPALIILVKRAIFLQPAPQLVVCGTHDYMRLSRACHVGKGQRNPDLSELVVRRTGAAQS
jgi:hypothetical protein